MSKILDYLLPILFEKLPILSWIDGYKRTIGNYLIVLSSILAGLQAANIGLPYVNELSAWTAYAIAFITRYAGDLHAESKLRRGA